MLSADNGDMNNLTRWDLVEPSLNRTAPALQIETSCSTQDNN